MRETKAAMMRGVEATVAKIVANNTVEYRRATGERVIRLHHTDIVTFSPDGDTITLDSGGWRTPTTKDRINSYSPFPVYSRRGSWLIGDGVPYYDGMRIVNGQLPSSKPSIVKSEAKLGKAVVKFVNKVRTLKELPRPSNGDCWYCLMFDNVPPKEGSHGDIMGWRRSAPGDGRSRDTNHLREHLKDGYVPGALLVNAMRWAGYRDEQIALHYEVQASFGKDAFCRATRRYLRSQLGLAG